MNTDTKVLIVEDEKITAEDLTRTLNYMGYSVSGRASSSEEALKEIEGKEPDLILMDIKLKGETDGVMAVKQIQKRFDIPIIYMTALTDETTLQRVKVTKPFGFVCKPVDEKDLKASIEMALYRYKLDRKLKESEEQYRDLVEKSEIAILIDDKEGNLKYSNNKLAELFGYSIEEMLRQSIRTIVHPEDVERVSGFHRKRIQGKKAPSRYEFKGIKKDGSEIYLEVDAVVLKKEESIIGTRSYIWDITDRKKTEEALRESEQKYRNLVENANDGIVIIKDKKIIYANPRMAEIIGYRRDELVNTPFTKYVHHDELPKALDRYERRMAGEKVPSRYESIILDKQGQDIFVEFNASVIPYQGKPADVVIVHDITERKQAEERIRESEKEFRNIFENALDGMILFDKSGRILRANDKAALIFGGTREELLGKHFTKLGVFTSRNIPFMLKAFKKALGGEQYGLDDVIIKNKKGQEIHLEASAVPLKKGKKVVGLLVVARDVTERKLAEEEKERLQAQLVHSEKMAGIGTLSGGIAHEFNNLLQIMRGHIEYARKTQRKEDIEEAYDLFIRHADRAARIIKDLLTFSIYEPSEKQRGDITEAIEAVLLLVEEQFKKQNIEIIRKYRKVSQVEMNKAEMQQVFLNMMTNARDAMLSKGGKLVIGINQDKENVKVSFTDSGRGIEKKNLSHVFDPFYTTKQAANSNSLSGTGLGLSVSYGVVKRHGGTIEIESEPNKRTTFTVKLPVSGAEVKRKVVKKKEKGRAKMTKEMNILVADDEEIICRMLNKWLSTEGFQVKSVLTGKKAIDMVKKEYFDVLLLDLVMPGMPTIEVLEKIKEISPETKVVIITGQLPHSKLLKSLKQKGASSFIQKPFRIDDILKIMRA